MEKFLKLFLILSLIYLMRTSASFSCRHSEFQKKVEIEKIDVIGHSIRQLQNSIWQPIRIYVDYTALESQIGQITRDLVDNLKIIMENAVKYIQQLVMVKRFTTPLIVKSCYTTPQISKDVYQTGVAADLVIFPFFKLTYQAYSEVYSAVCKSDSLTNRPVAGLIEFQKNLDLTMVNFKENRTMFIIHQIYHILGFSSELFGYFRDQNGNSQSYDKIVSSSTVNGKVVYMIKTPKVLEAARKHFDCNSMQGVELENIGGIGSHWKSRFMYGDFMTSEELPENVISDISLALLEDSGWYKVNLYTGGLFRYGKRKGCQFVTSKCIQNGESISKNEFPVTQGMARTCFAGRTAKGIAYIQDYKDNIPTEYQYFVAYPKKGGYEFADYCPVTTPSELPGRYDAGSCWYGYSQYNEKLGEKIGPKSYCFYSSLTIKEDVTLQNYKDKYLPICYEVTCNVSNKSYSVSIGETSVECSSKGGPITIDKYDGKFYCADYNLICTKTIDCADVFDCIDKQSTTADLVVIEPDISVNVTVSVTITDDWLFVSNINYPYFLSIILLFLLFQ